LADGTCRGLFGTCGVRGVVGDAITEEVVARLGTALAQSLGPGRRVAVGRDTRPSGPALAAALVDALAREGAEVCQLGVVPTPALYYLTRELAHDAGVMITASHNPVEYNGLKLCNGQGMCADQQGIEERYLEPLAPAGGHRGRVVELDGTAEFAARMRSVCPSPRHPLRLVVDCACGPNSTWLPGFLREMGHEVLERNCVPDLTQCDRLPEPMPSTLGATVDYLLEQGADAGLCFDGDNDRVVFLDREGFLGFQTANAALALVAMEESGRREVVGSVETGRYVEEAVRRGGGRLHRTVVGDVNVAREVQRLSAAAGVEECGHYILPAVGHFSDTVYPAALLLARRDINQIRQQLADIPQVFAAEQRIDCEERQKQEAMAAVASGLPADGGVVNDSDGLRVDWEDGWLLVRPSGTSPYMKVTAEAFTPERRDELLSRGTRHVEEALR
jgi:phosphomannomutase